MTFTQKDGQFNLFRNDKKETEKQPDFRGEVRLGDETYWVSAWERTGPKCGQYFSVSMQPKKEAFKKVKEDIEDSGAPF